MSKKKVVVRLSFLRVFETLADIVALAFSLQMIVKMYIPQLDMYYTVFGVNTCAYVLSAIRAKAKDKLEFFRYLVIAALYSVIWLLLFLHEEESYDIVNYIFAIYLLTVIYSRIIRMIRKRKVWYIIINVIICLGLLEIMLVAVISSEWLFVYSCLFLGIFVPIQMLVRVTILSFSHIRYDILINVVRKSMALEILSGLMILIVSFSFALTMIEPGIGDYFDALWYCFAVVTTIGFGDISAVTVLGRVLSIILGLYGIIVVSLITSIIVNFYTEVNKEDSGAAPESLDVKGVEAEKEIVSPETVTQNNGQESDARNDGQEPDTKNDGPENEKEAES